MQNLEGGSQRGDDPEKSSSTADGAAKPRQKCLTVHDETWARHTHRFVEDYHYRCFTHSWKNVPLGFFFPLLIFATLIWQGKINILPFRCCQLTSSKSFLFPKMYLYFDFLSLARAWTLLNFSLKRWGCYWQTAPSQWGMGRLFDASSIFFLQNGHNSGTKSRKIVPYVGNEPLCGYQNFYFLS